MVVPVEPVSLTIGVVALASLFSTCVECFDYFKAGQAFEEDFELLLVKLDVEKTRLLIWGNAVGVLKPEGEGRVADLNNSQKAELIGRCLDSIKSLLSDTDKFQNLYGLRSAGDIEKNARNHNILSINSMNVFTTYKRRFWGRFGGQQSRLSLAMRTRWAIHDKPKFESLVNHLKDLIDGLNEVIFVNREAQDQIMHDDIVSILDISKLRLVQSACEGSYTTLSKAASTVIAASEFGTIDRRNIEEWLDDEKGMSDDDDGDAATGPKVHGTIPNNAERSVEGSLSIPLASSSKVNLAPIFETIPGLKTNGFLFFVLTRQCRMQASLSPCQLSKLGNDCTDLGNNIISHKSLAHWSVGKRITDTLNPHSFTSVDLTELIGVSEDDMTDLQKLVLPVATIFIYCAPCACLLATAFSICKTAGDRAHAYFKFRIRPDDRLISSCCSQNDRSIGLMSIIEKVKEIENPSSKSNTSNLTLIDRLWVEQRLYEIEEETDLPQPISKLAEMGGKLLSSHGSDEDTAGIVILGELMYCLPIIRSRPFPSKPRIPKETEMFQLKLTWDNSAVRYVWQRKFWGTFTPKHGPMTPSCPSNSSGTVPRMPLSHDAVTNGPALSISSTPAQLGSSQATSAYTFPVAARQRTPPPSPDSKRQKTSPAPSVTMDEAILTTEREQVQDYFDGYL